MNNEAITPTAQQDAEALLPLLKEYSEKLNRCVDKLLNLVRPPMNPAWEWINKSVRAEYQYLTDTVALMEKPVLRLTRLSSQLLEHTELDMLVAVELKLRLDETETALLTAQKLLAEFRGFPR